ncbi:MAG: DUF58 domain-containing protein [Pirellulales bacterium]
MMLRAASLALLILVTLVFRLGLLTYSVYALVALFWTSRWLAKTWSNSLTVSRSALRLTAEVGQTIPFQVTVRNTGKWPVGWVLVEDLLPRNALLHEPPRLRVAGERLLLTMLRAGGERSMYYQLQCNRRGYYQIGPVVLETGDLFGLHRRYRVGEEPVFLLVLPEVLPIEGYDIASRRPMGEVLLTHRLFEDPTRISGVRAYQPGDPLNRIHWRATARTGQLHSKVYEASTVAGATILMDFHRDSHDVRHEPVRSELAVTAAASIAHCLFQQGQQIGLATNARDAVDRIRTEGYVHDWRTRDAARQAAAMQAQSERLRPVVVPTQIGVDQFRQILETLARMELTDGLSFAQLVSEVDDRLPRDATVIAILPRVTEEHAIALANLRRRGLSVTAVLNLFDEYEYAQAAGPLIAAGIETRQLQHRDSIRSLCRRYVVG